MAVRIIFSLIIVLSCRFIGNEMADILKRRVTVLDSFICAISMVEDYISALSMPLNDIYLNISTHIKPLADFFIKLSSSPLSTEAAWKKELKSISSLTDEDRKIIISMASTLGTSDTETQLNNLRLVKKRLTDNLCDASEKVKSDSGMYKSVSIFTGIGLAVLLI